MKYSVILLIALASCASCQTVKDVADAPSALDQDRSVLLISNVIEVGIHGTTKDVPIMVRSYGRGSVMLRGLGDCGIVATTATDKVGWVEFNQSILPKKEFCVYSVQNSTNGFDAPSIGHVLVRRFMDPNVLPLRTVVNLVDREGVNWVQLREDSSPAFNSTMSVPAGGIHEDREIKIYLGGKSGLLNITGCGLATMVQEYSNQEWISFTVDYLMRGAQLHTCVLTITANHYESLKQSASVLVKTYKGAGSFLSAPLVKDDGDEWCFEFTDPYVVGMMVNDKWSKKSKMCAGKNSSLKVEGVTSKNRIFYGEFESGEWRRTL